MKVVRVEPTPNPSAFKFISDEPLLPVGVRQFNNIDEAKEDSLAQSLFAIGGVSTVYYTQNFVTLTLEPNHDWGDVQSGVAEALKDYVAPDAAPAPESSSTTEGSDDEMMTQIRHILDSRVIPYLAADGGGMEILGMDGKTLHIRYQGACGSCPSSVAGTLQAIRNMLKSEVDEEIEVVNV